MAVPLDMNILTALRARRRAPVVRRPPVLGASVPAIGRGRIVPRAGGAVSSDPLWNQANTMVGNMTSPLIERLARQRVAAEQNARAAYARHTGALEQGLMATAAPIRQAYQGATQSAAATEDALAARLRGEGDSAGQSLAAKLAQIGNPAAAGATADLSKVYSGASNAGFAHGAADIQKLIARGAEAEAYTGKLPQIARLEGNRALESALSEQRGQFGEQETAITENAMQNAFELWQNLVERKDAQSQAAAEQVQNTMELAARERMALTALRASAVTAAEKRAFDEQMKAADRKLKLDIANINADVRRDTDNPPATPKPPNVTGPPTQAWITVNGVKTKNPNWHGTWKGNTPVAPTSTSTSAPKVTPKYVLTSVWGALNAPYNETSFRWPTDIYRKIKGSPKAIDGILTATINNQLLGHNIDPNSQQGKNVRRAMLKKLNGRKWRDNSGAIWTYEYGGK